MGPLNLFLWNPAVFNKAFFVANKRKVLYKLGVRVEGWVMVD